MDVGAGGHRGHRGRRGHVLPHFFANAYVECPFSVPFFAGKGAPLCMFPPTF